MYGEKWAEPSFNAIAFYLHVAGYFTFERADDRCALERWILSLDCAIPCIGYRIYHIS